MFILAYLLFHNYFIALFSAAGMALLPVVVFWSPSVGLDSSFVFFAMLAWIATLLYARKPTPIHGMLLLTSTALLLCVRLESFVFLPILFWLGIDVRKADKKNLFTRRDLPYLSLLAFLILIRMAVSVSVFGQKWCCAEALPLEAFHPSYLARNILPNILSLFTKREFPLGISVCAVLGLITMKNRRIAMIAAWLGAFFLLYSTYYAGMLYSSEFSGSYGRYFLILVPPLLLLAAHAIQDMWKTVRRKLTAMVLLIFIAGSIVPTAVFYTRFVVSSPYYALVDAGPETIHDVVEYYLLPNTPPDAIILTSMTAFALMKNRPTALFWSFLNDQAVTDVVIGAMKQGRRAFATAPYQCNLYPEQCEKIDHLIEFVPVAINPPHPQGIQFVELKLKEQ